MNKAFLIGNICSDIEQRRTNSGNTVAMFRIAVRRDYKNSDGEYESDFISVVAFDKCAELILKYRAKGDPIAIDGGICTRNYKAQDGSKRYVVEVVARSVQFLNRKAATQDNKDSFEPIDNLDGLPFLKG